MAAHELGASDVHLLPTPEGLDIRTRIDGVLQDWGVFPSGTVSDIITRLKVMAELLTYRTDLPQEGRDSQTAVCRRSAQSAVCQRCTAKRSSCDYLPRSRSFHSSIRLGCLPKHSTGS